MCGRYVTAEVAEIEREYRVDRRNAGTHLNKWLGDLRESFNVAPTQSVPIVRVIRDAGGERESLTMKWGMIPFWAKGVPPKYSTINCTIEKMETAPTWRGPWKKGQRCIMPCKGFYEWQVKPDGKKQPYFIRPAEDATTFAFAALWDESINAEGEAILSCAVITMPANELMTEIHNVKHRMPAILDKADIDAWLKGTNDEAKAVLKQYPSKQMMAYKVSSRVNTPRNNSPDLLDMID